MEQPERKLDLKRAVSINEALDAVPDTHLAPLVEYIEQLEKGTFELDERHAQRLKEEVRGAEAEVERLEVKNVGLERQLDEARTAIPMLEAQARGLLAKVDKLKLHMQDYHQMHDHERDLRITAEKDRDTYKESWERLTVEKAQSSWGEFQRQEKMLKDAQAEVAGLTVQRNELEAQVKRLLAKESERIGDQLGKRDYGVVDEDDQKNA